MNIEKPNGLVIKEISVTEERYHEPCSSAPQRIYVSRSDYNGNYSYGGYIPKKTTKYHTSSGGCTVVYKGTINLLGK